jgi:hypothetical protein
MNDFRSARIAELLATYGADRARWPAAERARFAHDGIDRDAATQGETAPGDAWSQARELDVLLDALAAPPPPSGLRRNVLLAVAREPRISSRGLLGAWRELWRDLGGARIAAPALVLALGVGVGLDWATTPTLAGDADAEDLLTLVQFEETYTELDP